MNIFFNHILFYSKKTFPPTMKVSDVRCQQANEKPKKRLNNICGQNVVNKKPAHTERMQGTGCRVRVPMRRSRRPADKSTALVKLVSPYGKVGLYQNMSIFFVCFILFSGFYFHELLRQQLSK